MSEDKEYKKLAHLAQVLRQPLPKNVGFSLNQWRDEGSEWEVASDYQDNVCGTVCCACGLATMHPELEYMGLFWSDYKGIQFVPVESWNVLSSWEAIEECFNLTKEEAAYLFRNDSYSNVSATSPDEVADRIDEFIANKLANCS